MHAPERPPASQHLLDLPGPEAAPAPDGRSTQRAQRRTENENVLGV